MDGGSGLDAAEWTFDEVITADGTVLPVRATARRPTWPELPASVRAYVEDRLGAPVTAWSSAGTGFTPGFASRLDLADGSPVFVKAASTEYDERHGWPLSDAYRLEARNLDVLGDRVGSPPMLWHGEPELAGARWIVVCFEYVDAAPPRRPWRRDQLATVLDRLAELAPALAQAPPELQLGSVVDHLLESLDERLARAAAGWEPAWLSVVSGLTSQAARHLSGSALVHMDLRDDNVLVGRDGRVWLVDWNWPGTGAPWIDLICVLLSAYGDGHDVEPLLAAHPLTREVPAEAVDCLLAVLLTFWAATRLDAVPHGSPHLRVHQTWYADVTERWLRERLSRRAAVAAGR